MMSRAGGRHREEEDDGDVGDSCIISNVNSFSGKSTSSSKNRRGALASVARPSTSASTSGQLADTQDDLYRGNVFNAATMAVAEDSEVPMSDMTYAGFRYPSFFRIVLTQRPMVLLVYLLQSLRTMALLLICPWIIVLKDFLNLTLTLHE